MMAIPPAIAERFDQFLIGKSLPHTVRVFYTERGQRDRVKREEREGSEREVSEREVSNAKT
jgi:hypothetical protein